MGHTPWLQCAGQAGGVNHPEEEVLVWILRGPAGGVAPPLVARVGLALGGPAGYFAVSS